MDYRREIYQVFIDHYGEDRVDDRETSIIVWYPEVTITNENEESHTMKDLFVEVKIDPSNNCSLLGSFKIAKTTFTATEASSGYIHSHVPSCYGTDRMSKFYVPCLGNGPIKNTVATLNAANDFDELTWRLFCVELDKFMETESLAGGPYIRMSSIGSIEKDLECSLLSMYAEGLNNILKSFAEQALSKYPFKYSYCNGLYDIAMSDLEFAITVSNLFLDWARKEKYTYDSIKYYLTKVIINNGKAYRVNPELQPNFTGPSSITFKGQEIPLVIEASEKEDVTPITVLSKNFLGTLKLNIINSINFTYGRMPYNVAKDSNCIAWLGGNPRIIF